ncbi:MAG: hypothetical protein Q8R20_00400 [Nanoarchaeota archaeon]|nr:hypothetical protein [Nanoarchaeota archaeon]
MILATTALLPLVAQGVNIWEGTSIGSSTDGRSVGCNEAIGGCNFEDIGVVFTNILQFLFAIAIPITVAMIVFGAIQMVISRGSPDKVKQGKDTMVKAVIGLIIVLASYLIVITVRMVLTGVTK